MVRCRVDETCFFFSRPDVAQRTTPQPHSTQNFAPESAGGSTWFNLTTMCAPNNGGRALPFSLRVRHRHLQHPSALAELWGQSFASGLGPGAKLQGNRFKQTHLLSAWTVVTFWA